MFDFLKIKGEVEKVGGAIREARGKVEQLKRERENLACAPAMKEDVVRLMLRQIHDAAAEYPTRLKAAIDNTTVCGKESSTDTRGGKTPVGIFCARPHMGAVANVLDVQDSLCFILQNFTDAKGNSLLETAIRNAVDLMQWPADARPVAGREAALEKLDKDIAKLEQETTDLRKSAADVGVVI